MGRAPCCEKVGLKKGRWTKEEDEILARYIEEHGEGSWRTLPKNAGTDERAKPILKSCRFFSPTPFDSINPSCCRAAAVREELQAALD